MTTLKLNRSNPGQPWGFRIHGGRDFQMPLVVLKVTANSIAATSGLSPGDQLVRINGVEAGNLTHKAAQDLIKNSGNGVEFVVAKGTNTTWKPSVDSNGEVSLKHSKGRPWEKGGLVNKQFNSPIGLYSETAIAETLSAQAEVLGTGAIGVNFKKNEKKYNHENSEVYKMLMEKDDEGCQEQQSPAMQRVVGGEIKIPPVQLRPVQQGAVTNPVVAPTTNPNPTLAPGANICADCERLIIGVFVRIKDRALHVECFKCATCGQSLKNVGYYNINNKLYCDIHAKLVARQQAPPQMSPVAVEPNANAPSAPSNFAPASNFAPPKPFSYAPNQNLNQNFAPLSPSVVTPTGFHQPTQVHHVTAPKSPGIAPFQQSQQSSSFYESFESSFEKSSSTSGKVLWPPTEQVEGLASSSKFKQQHVPYMPVSSLLQQAPQNSSFQQNQNIQQKDFQQNLQQKDFQQNLQQSQQKDFQQTQNQQNNQQNIQQFAPFTSPQNFSPLPTQSAKPNFQSISTPLKNSASNFGGGGKSSSSNILANRLSRGILNQPSARVAVCGGCSAQIRGPFISTATKFFCPSHFKCASCSRDLMDVGFVDLGQNLHCEFCWESHIAPICAKCGKRIKFECLKAVGKEWHTNCFSCKQCGKAFGKEPFFVEDGGAFCQGDWNELFTTKCHGCGFPIEAGDRWVEAMGNNYHSQCFNCSACKKNLEGQSFFAKAGRPFCKSHAR